MDTIIKIENLNFRYIKEGREELVEAIKGLNLNLERGSFTAILGRNGSGKSTLAKNINALLIPTEGRITVNGFDTRDEAHLWDIRQSAGMVFQNPDNQLVSSIVEDDVAFGPENLGIEPQEIRERVDGALKAVGMYEHRKKAPHMLSGGQKQRIAIAGVAAMTPDCIIFDEPTAMLDPKGRKEVMDIIKKLHKNGITIILITHFMEEAAEAEHVVIMDKGEAVLEGSPVEIFADVKKIREAGLDVPPVVDMADRLREKGIDVPKGIISTEEMVEYLCQYK
ncbi:MAG: energy-coupling factor transporter ATPase [Anaerovoracaceae bacterium]